MKPNPYDSPTAKTARRKHRESRGVYWIASGVALILLMISISVLIGVSNPSINSDGISISIPGASVSNTPTGDPIIYSDRQLQVLHSGVFFVIAILVTFTLILANGLVYCWRWRRRKP